MSKQKIQNEYIALLLHDKVEIKHPITKNTVILYRIISLQPIRSNFTDRWIAKHSIGGFVQSVDNINENSPGWIENSGRVFDNAVISGGTIVSESALVFENAKVDSSIVQNHARVSGNSNVIDSVIADTSEIKGNANVVSCKTFNASMIFEDANVVNTELNTGSIIRGKAKVTDSTLLDISQIQGDSNVNNCKLEGRTVIMDGKHEGLVLDTDLELSLDATNTIGDL